MKHSQRAQSIDNISFLSCTLDDDPHESSKDNISIIDKSETNNNISMENLNKMDNKPKQNNNNEENEPNIIPWRAQLRKTNSRLSLIG